jgi:glutamyl-tRNA synthetase, bacterial family
MIIRTRFAPSPTGYLHLGNARTALFNALLARRLGGHFILRIEDTDRARSKPEYTAALTADLSWLGILWNEGPEVSGPNGPYTQSERFHLYQRYFQILEEKGLAYPCFCSPKALELARQGQRAAGLPPRYPGTCAQLSAFEVRARLAEGLKPTLRFRVTERQTVAFNDLVRGELSFASEAIGDFVIHRADGSPAFLFSNALDDALMGITHVLRGEDHMANTPRQLLLLKALQLPAARYGHIALIVGPEGNPLSKRHGSRTLKELREAGYLPGALRNYLARLGHSYIEDDYLDVEQLTSGFEMDRLGRAPARFDEAQLIHWQRKATAQASAQTLWRWAGSRSRELVPSHTWEAFLEAVRKNVTLPADLDHWAQVLYADPLTPSPAAQEAIARTGSEFFLAALTVLQDVGYDFGVWIRHLKEVTGAKGKAIFMPLRAALTGELEGPELAPLIQLMPRERVRSRLLACAEHVSHRV